MDKADILLAWKRIKKDLIKSFFKKSFEINLIEKDIEGWQKKLLKNINSKQYEPSPLILCDIPKVNGGIRPGGYLKVEDRLVYTALLGKNLGKIYDFLKWSQNKIDFSHILNKDISSTSWLSNPFESWDNFRKASLEILNEQGYNFVLFTDITGYYENIDINSLISDLKIIGFDRFSCDLLSKCLNKWAQSNGRGIPQGSTSSDILGKIYLNNIDQNFNSMGFVHTRYADDIRVFCKTLSEAKRAQMELIKLLRTRGLNLQSAKSIILRSDEAKVEIEGVIPILVNVKKNLTEAVGLEDSYEMSFSTNPYPTELVSTDTDVNNEDEEPLEIIKQNYQSYFIDYKNSFDKSLFHFLLNRLAALHDDFATQHCCDLLKTHPEETEYILKYFSNVELKIEVIEKLIIFLESDYSIYPYQNFQIIEWYTSNKIKELSTKFLSYVRRKAFDQREPFYLINTSRILVGLIGNAADLELLLNFYPNARDELEKTILILSLKRMEVGRRNSFYARIKNDGYLQSLAVSYIKGNQ